jgi:signal transduction histidine kinase
VRVALTFAPDELDLVVADDGSGLTCSVDETGPAHQGVRNMRERARRLGGRLVVEPAAGRGTRVTLAVPLDSEIPEADPASSDPLREVTAP